MKPSRFDWQDVPGDRTIRDIEQSATRAGHSASYTGSVLYVYNRTTHVWLQFMMMYDRLVYRRVPGQMRIKHRASGPSFICDSCGHHLSVDQLACIANVERSRYNVCTSCVADNVLQDLKAAGLDVRVDG